MAKWKFDFDTLLTDLGTCGLYQMWIYFWANSIWVSSAWHMMVMTFHNAAPPHTCRIQPGFWDTIGLSETDYIVQEKECEVFLNSTFHPNHSLTIPCNTNNTRLHYDAAFGKTIVSEWDLTCSISRQAMASTAGAMYMFGVMTGALVIPIFADRFGRKWTLLAGLWAVMPFGICLYFVQSYLAYIALRFITGALWMGVIMISWSISCEIINSKWRSYVGIGGSLLWVVGFVWLGIVANYVRDWRTLQLVIGIPLLFHLLYPLFTRESIPWLAAKNHKDALEREVRFAAKINKKDINISKYYKPHPKDDAWVSLLRSLIQIFTTPTLAMYAIIMCYSWFVDSFVYYGLSLFSTELAENRYLSFCLSGAVEAPAYFAISFSMSTLGRRISSSLFHGVAGVSLIILPFIPKATANGTDLQPLILTFGLIGKFSISAAFMGDYLYAAEIYPTTVRTFGVGLSSFAARIGGILAPYVGLLASYNKQLPPTLFGVLTCLVAVLVFLLPETKGRVLADYPHEIPVSRFCSWGKSHVQDSREINLTDMSRQF